MPASCFWTGQQPHFKQSTYNRTCGLPEPSRVDSWLPDKTLTEGSFNKCFQVKKPFFLGWFQASLCQGLNSSSHTAIYCLMPGALKKKGRTHQALGESWTLFLDFSESDFNDNRVRSFLCPRTTMLFTRQSHMKCTWAKTTLSDLTWGKKEVIVLILK